MHWAGKCLCNRLLAALSLHVSRGFILRAQVGPAQERALFHARFSFDRTPLRRMHAALRAAHNPHFRILPARPQKPTRVPTALQRPCALHALS
jgi:hypothetical protein